MRIKNHAFSISVCKTLSSRLLFFIETMESIRLVCGIETPGWLIEQIPVHLDQQAVGRFETRQNVTRYTFTRYRQIMNAMPSNSIPRVPTRDEALTLPKRRWEAIFQKWRSDLRHVGEEYGCVDTSIDALTYDLRNAFGVVVEVETGRGEREADGSASFGEEDAD